MKFPLEGCWFDKAQQELAFQGEALHFHDNHAPLCFKRMKGGPKLGIIRQEPGCQFD